MLEPEAVAVQGRVESQYTIDEMGRIVDLLLVAECIDEYPSEI